MRILYLDIDTLRPDHLGCYGYHRSTSPTIDRIASEGIRFNNFYTSDAPCLPSRSAMMSGRFGIHTGAINHGGSTADFRLQGKSREMRSALSLSSFPATLKQAGLYTAYIGGFGERHSIYSFYAGFREICDTGLGGGERAELIHSMALEWIRKKGHDDNWYLHLHYWDPHTPYRSPPGFQPFTGEPMIGLYSEDFIREQRKLGGPHTLQDINMYDNMRLKEYPRQPGEVRNMTEMRELIDGYDSGIRYVDNAIAALAAEFQQMKIWDDMVVIVSSDHGENFGELGLYAEHGTADVATCRIPLILRWPGKTRPNSEHDGFWYNIDLLPTFADLLGVPSQNIWDGMSFAGVLRSEEANATTGRDELIISQNAHVCQRSVRFCRDGSSWLYIYTYHDGWHPHFGEEMLFDMEKDPFEQNDLAQSHPELCHEGAHRLHRWHTQMLHSRPEGYTGDPMWLVMEEGGPEHARGHLPKYLKRLKESGRSDKAEILRRRHPKELAG